MKLVNILENDVDYSNLIRLIESGEEDTIYVTRDQKPIAKITSCINNPVTKRIGIAKGKLIYPDNIDELNDEIAEMFGMA